MRCIHLFQILDWTSINQFSGNQFPIVNIHLFFWRQAFVNDINSILYACLRSQHSIDYPPH